MKCARNTSYLGSRYSGYLYFVVVTMSTSAGSQKTIDSNIAIHHPKLKDKDINSCQIKTLSGGISVVGRRQSWTLC